MLESCSSSCFSPLLIGKLAGAAFFAILFLQSSLDKLNDWNGNLAWITGYFEKTPFKRFTFPLLAVLTVLELSAGLLSGVSIVTVLFLQSTDYLYWAALLSSLSLLGLFMGMRIAKDYPASASMASYFAVLIGWIILLSL